MKIKKMISMALCAALVTSLAAGAVFIKYGNKVSAAAAVHSLDETKVDAINAAKFVTLGKTTLTSYK